MSRPSRIVLSVLGAWCWALEPRPVTAAEEFVFHHENVMGTALELRVRAIDLGAARGAEGRVLETIDRLSAILSGYDSMSVLRRWMDTPRGPQAVPDALLEVLEGADRWRDRTAGAFDPRVAAVSALWSAAADQGTMPTSEEIDAAREALRRDSWRVDRQAGHAERLGDAPVSLDGIAKGLIVERACDAAIGSGVLGALLNVGGDLCARGVDPWIVGLAPAIGDSESSEPTRLLEVRDGSLATSGPSHRGFRIGDRWHSHIIDPRTGRPADRIGAVTVAAPRGLDADALATALNVLTTDEGLRLVDAMPGVECLIVSAEGRIARSVGWELLEHPGPMAVARDDANDPEGAPGVEGEEDPAWGTTHEFVIDFEINRPETEGGRYRRPFVVIWIEDEEDHVVRHLLMWVSMGGAGPEQWLPDLSRWYRSDAARGRIGKRSRAYAIGRSTRPPGTYSASWDGKGDDGAALPPGRYTLFIEAAREHGTHQLIRTPITVGGEEFDTELEGGVEIKDASVAYRAKGEGR